MAFNLPPGCRVSDIPGNGPCPPCDVCGGDPDKQKPPGNCICPECPVCGDYGNPACYQDHGMVKTLEQEARRAEMEKRWALSSEAEAVSEAIFERDEIARAPDTTPVEIERAVMEAERCLHVLGRAYKAGIKPNHAVRRLRELADEIQTHHDQWQPPTTAP